MFQWWLLPVPINDYAKWFCLLCFYAWLLKSFQSCFKEIGSMIVFWCQGNADTMLVSCYHDLSQQLAVALRHEEKRCGYLSEQASTMCSIQDDMASQPEGGPQQSTHPPCASTVNTSSMCLNSQHILHVPQQQHILHVSQQSTHPPCASTVNTSSMCHNSQHTLHVSQQATHPPCVTTGNTPSMCHNRQHTLHVSQQATHPSCVSTGNTSSMCLNSQHTLHVSQ